jgi:hypothetical protein
MAIIKLQKAGESITWRIKAAETVPGNYGAQVKFTGENGDLLFLSQQTADNQLERCELTVATCVGETLTFSRTENKKTPGAAPYWNITVADAVDRSAPAASKRLPPPSKPLPFDEESFPPDGPYAPDAQNYPIRQGNMPNLSAPAPTDDDAPEWVTGDIAPAKPAGVAPNATKRLAYITAYLDLLGYVKAHSGLKDEVAIQAATATLHIGLKQEGLR